MKKRIAFFTVFLAAFCVYAQDVDFSSGWGKWPDGVLTVNTPAPNVAVFSGTFSKAAGYASGEVDTRLAGRTLVLTISNSANSRFSEKRMLRLTYNSRTTDDVPLLPVDTSLLVDKKFGEYLRSGDITVEYKIPRDFDGKLGFVFYHATLRDLRIQATVR